jgi:hypothetical protein
MSTSFLAGQPNEQSWKTRFCTVITRLLRHSARRLRKPAASATGRSAAYSPTYL